MSYYEVQIKRHHAGFGMWQAVHDGSAEQWPDEQALLDSLSGGSVDELIQLTDATVAAGLPAGVEDIRGRIYHEPDKVYAYHCEDDPPTEWAYTGIASK